MPQKAESLCFPSLLCDVPATSTSSGQAGASPPPPPPVALAEEDVSLLPGTASELSLSGDASGGSVEPGAAATGAASAADI